MGITIYTEDIILQCHRTCIYADVFIMLYIRRNQKFAINRERIGIDIKLIILENRGGKRNETGKSYIYCD